MEQHPIPQQISSYQFRLVGDMTLKQFFQLAGGFLVALVFYSLPILPIIKWPFVIVSAILGIALAFLPLEERPLERWIFAFFRAIYTPTMFYWQKTNALPKYFQDEPTAANTPVNSQQDTALKTYLETNGQKSGSLSKLEGEEKNFLSKLAGIFTGAVSILPQKTPATTQTSVAPKPEMKIPENNPIRIQPATSPHLVVEEKPKAPSGFTPITTQQVSPIMAGEEIISTKQAIFSVDAAPPTPPTMPNVIVGQVVDESRRIVEGAIMEIKDEMGRPTRALRSNRAGHFITVTPLESGRYTIVTEKDGYEFMPISFDVAGTIIPPILVQGRRIAVQQPVISNQQI